MKKTLVALAVLAALGSSSVFAAPAAKKTEGTNVTASRTEGAVSSHHHRHHRKHKKAEATTNN